MLNSVYEAWRKPRVALEQLFTVCNVLASAYMSWKLLSCVANSASPIVVVLSGSMEPAFHRGDILVLENRMHVNVGDIVVYNVKGKDIPIVHRVMRSHESSKNQMLLTKGDNNPLDDTELYTRNQLYLNRDKELLGKVRAFLPTVGYITILINEKPWIKQVVLGLVGLSSIISGD